MLWDYSKKVECDDIANIWKMTFQALEGRGKQFLKLHNNDSNDIEPSYITGGPWLQTFRHSNTLCVHAMRAITNHAPIGEYKLRFFSKKEFKYSYGIYPIESRRHISMIVVGSMAIRIQEGTHLATLSCF